MRILIIEDEYNLADVIKTKLETEKYLVDTCQDGEDGLFSALTDIYDLIILDVMLPNVSGFEILKQIRENNINSKVIMLTAKSMIEDKLNGFKNGADDYITKPFHMDELVARVNVQLKKMQLFMEI
jgi:DNA-binding response OmpR family regulator